MDGGIREIIFSVGYKAETIQAYFGNVYRSVPVRYSWENFPLGTGGAIARALEKEDASPVLVVNGDTLTEVDYPALADWFVTVSSPVGVVLCQVPDVSRYGSVVLSGDRVVEFSEKGKKGPGFINAGTYILRPKVFSLYPCGECFSFETEFLQRYCHELAPRSFVADGYFIDIGTPEDYARAQRELGPGRVAE